MSEAVDDNQHDKEQDDEVEAWGHLGDDELKQLQAYEREQARQEQQIVQYHERWVNTIDETKMVLETDDVPLVVHVLPSSNMARHLCSLHVASTESHLPDACITIPQLVLILQGCAQLQQLTTNNVLCQPQHVQNLWQTIGEHQTLTHLQLHFTRSASGVLFPHLSLYTHLPGWQRLYMLSLITQHVEEEILSSPYQQQEWTLQAMTLQALLQLSNLVELVLYVQQIRNNQPIILRWTADCIRVLMHWCKTGRANNTLQRLVLPDVSCQNHDISANQIVNLLHHVDHQPITTQEMVWIAPHHISERMTSCFKHLPLTLFGWNVIGDVANSRYWDVCNLLQRCIQLHAIMSMTWTQWLQLDFQEERKQLRNPHLWSNVYMRRVIWEHVLEQNAGLHNHVKRYMAADEQLDELPTWFPSIRQWLSQHPLPPLTCQSVELYSLDWAAEEEKQSDDERSARREQNACVRKKLSSLFAENEWWPWFAENWKDYLVKRILCQEPTQAQRQSSLATQVLDAWQDLSKRLLLRMINQFKLHVRRTFRLFPRLQHLPGVSRKYKETFTVLQAMQAGQIYPRTIYMSSSRCRRAEEQSIMWCMMAFLWLFHATKAPFACLNGVPQTGLLAVVWQQFLPLLHGCISTNKTMHTSSRQMICCFEQDPFSPDDCMTTSIFKRKHYDNIDDIDVLVDIRGKATITRTAPISPDVPKQCFTIPSVSDVFMTSYMTSSASLLQTTALIHDTTAHEQAAKVAAILQPIMHKRVFSER